MSSNYTLRDEIRDYWSARAATFDQQVGHEIFSEAERQAWQDLFLRHLGPGEGRSALDLASGTGVISHLLDGLGFKVTGLDWSDAMLTRARAKAQARGARIRFVMGDAERTLEKPESYDVIVTRHLVWTLVDPAAAFREWHSLLKPGGKVLAVASAKYDVDYWFDLWFPVQRWLTGPRTQPPLVRYSARRLRFLFDRFIEHKVHKRHLRRKEVPHLWRWLPMHLLERVMGRVLVLKAFKPVSAARLLPAAAAA